MDIHTKMKYGSNLLYHGKEYLIEFAKPGEKPRFDGSSFFLPADEHGNPDRTACIALYKKLAGRDLVRRTVELARIMNVVPTAIKINGATARWGSCSEKRSINFSWRLITADDGAIDYVLVHELAHITELNHSADFWRIVAGIIPDYKARRERLTELQKRLLADGF